MNEIDFSLDTKNNDHKMIPIMSEIGFVALQMTCSYVWTTFDFFQLQCRLCVTDLDKESRCWRGKMIRARTVWYLTGGWWDSPLIGEETAA
jgi:hypothetical protein